MSRFYTYLKIKNIIIALVLFSSLVLENKAFGQDCFTLYGPGGEPSLGLNRKLCITAPGNITLDAAAITATGYTWSTTALTNSIVVSTGGNYTVTVASGGVPNACVLNYVVTGYPNPVVNLGPDTSFCQGDSMVLNAPVGYPDYSWSDGAFGVDSIVIFSPNTYSVTVTDTNQCSGIDTVVVTNDTLPTPNMGVGGLACIGDTLTIDAGLGYIVYLWNGGQTTQTLDVDTAGIYSVIVTDSNGCVGSSQYQFGNHPNPVVNIGANDSLCDGGVKILNAGGGFVSYLWSDASIQQTASFTVTADPWVEVEDGNGCKGRDTMHLEIFPLPGINLGPDAAFCTNDSVVLDAGPGFVSYSWNNGNPTQTITVTNPGVYSVTIEDTNGCLNTDTNIVTQNPLPTVSIGNDIEYCQGTTFTQLLDAGSGFTAYAWMDGVFTQIRNVTEANDTVWVRVTDTNGCSNTDTLYVLENALPVLNLGTDDTICASQSYSLNAGNPNNSIVSYLWSTGAVNQTLAIPPNPNQIADSIVDYSVIITDNKGCVSTDTMELYAYALPRPVLGNDTAFCTGDPFSMILDAGTFISYVWSTGAFTQTINIGAVGMLYTVTVTDGNGCSNNEDILVIDNPLPTPNLGPDDSYCQGNSYTTILNPGGFVSYLWSDNSTGQVLAVSSAGTYSVTVTDINSCKNNDDIVITENPTPDVNLGSNVDFCEDDIVNHLLDATTQLVPGGSFNFLWSTGATTGTITANSFGTYIVTVSDQVTNCFKTSSLDIVPMQKAQPNLGADGLVCEGQLIKLDPNVTIPGYNYTWSTGATTATINVFETGIYWVRLDAANGTCIGLIDSVYYSPGVLPVVELGPNQFVCDGQKVQLLNGTSPFPDATYEWQDGSKRSAYTVLTTGDYEVEVTNQCGSVVDQVYIEFQDCSNVYVPNSFTPNEDGRNDIFYPKTDQEFTEYGFWVYDRWGGLVFKTNQPNFGWDGKINGKDAVVGVYVWRISYVSSFQEFGERIEKIGEFSLIR
jgi:gliding motility-associated-like protein